MEDQTEELELTDNEAEIMYQHYALVSRLANAELYEFKQIKKWAKKFMQTMKGEEDDTETNEPEKTIITRPSTIITLR